MCNVAGHIHDDVAPTTIAHIVPHDNTTPIPPSSSVPTPLHVVERLTDVPSPDDSNPANQTTTERPRIPVTSPDPATAGVIRDVVTSGITILLHAPETSTLAPPLSSTSSPLQHNVDLSTPSDSPNIPSSDPVLDNILTTESRHSKLAAPSASSGPASACDPGGAAAEVGGKPKPGLRKVALDPPR
ncbi:hypothetical protein EDB92DRAFT_125961 [Lactarius akahatsu]|uniref:Uncharacterized protein n=1 Tax=Lactarius akahatsu TaxID=416441 RepID=A0AAD4Q961_9AGAM|nr:hypothetical protein EDB92DRAFT_125961 [Lactarius akahatsu]